MRTQAGSGWGCLPGCWADDGGCDGPGLGGSPGDRTGTGRRTAVRSVPGAAGSSPCAPFGSAFGSAVLDHADSGLVCLVPVGLGRDGAAVWSGIFVLWGLRLFLAAQFRCALGGLPFGRSGHFCTKNLSSPVDCTKSAPEKNQKTCKKYLPFWGKMG